jgi:transposase
MNPVIGLDISKGKSDGQVFLAKGQPYGKTFQFLHNREGLQQLLNLISDFQNKTEKSPTIILESTGHYHQAVIQFLEEQRILFLVVNPHLSPSQEVNSTQGEDRCRRCLSTERTVLQRGTF